MIGDLQGCDSPLQRLLDRLDFSPSRDTIFLLGDLVNRGPSSLEVLRRLIGYGDAARCLLGNHDLHLLAAAHGIRPAHRLDTLQGILLAPDLAALLDWVRHQRMAIRETLQGQDILMVHAGVLPGWSATQTMDLAREVETVLRGPNLAAFLGQMYGNTPERWSDSLQGIDRLRVIVNALTRLRFCTTNGTMEFDSKEGTGTYPAGYLPWFDVPGRQTANMTVAFGHWSTLGWLGRSDVLPLDTGCVWGGSLSALKIGATPAANELIQVRCEQAQRPGS